MVDIVVRSILVNGVILTTFNWSSLQDPKNWPKIGPQVDQNSGGFPHIALALDGT